MVIGSTVQRESRELVTVSTGGTRFEQLKPRFEALQLPPETVVVINIESCEFVVGSTLADAISAFQARWDLKTPGYISRIGGPFRV